MKVNKTLLLVPGFHFCHAYHQLFFVPSQAGRHALLPGIKRIIISNLQSSLRLDLRRKASKKNKLVNNVNYDATNQTTPPEN